MSDLQSMGQVQVFTKNENYFLQNIVCQTVIREVGRILRLGAKKSLGARGFSLRKFFEFFRQKSLNFGVLRVQKNFKGQIGRIHGLFTTCTTFMAQRGRIIGGHGSPGPPPSNYLPDCNITIYETAAVSSAPF